jgi:hypothetical protein
VPLPVAESTLRYSKPVRSTKVSAPNLKRTELDKICSSKPCVRSNLSLSAVTVVELLPVPEVSRYLTCMVVGKRPLVFADLQFHYLWKIKTHNYPEISCRCISLGVRGFLHWRYFTYTRCIDDVPCTFPNSSTRFPVVHSLAHHASYCPVAPGLTRNI